MNKSTFFIVGKHPVIEALKNSKRKVLRVFLTEESKKTIHRENQNKNLLKDIKIFFKTKKELDKYTTKENLMHQGYVAEVEQLDDINIKEFIKEKNNLNIVCLDEVTDPRNIGSIIRSLVSFGINPRKLLIHKNWIDLDRFKPIPKKLTLKRHFNLPDRFSVICIARLTIIKGIKEFISVAKKIPEVSFIIVGNGPLESFVIDESKKTKNLYFMGSVDYSDLHLYYNLGDIFCIPSQYEEGYGRVAMEALACGSPVVGSNKGGIPEVVAQNVGILVDPSVENLTEAVSRLYKDRKLFQKLKQNCRSYAEKNFSSRNAEIILKGYDERENLSS